MSTDPTEPPPDESFDAPRPGGRRVAAALYGGTAVAALAGPWVARRLGRRLPSATAETVAMASLVGAAWTGIVVAERRRPFRRDWNRSRGDVGTDVIDLVVAASLAQLVGATLTAPLRRRLGDRLPARAMAALPRPVRVAVTLAAYDLFHSTHHRISHETGMWRFHAVHHSASRLYILNASRFHPLELLVDIAGEEVVLAVAGVDGPTRLTHQIVRAIYGQIQHGNIDMDSGPLNAVLSTPERHRWHHSTDPAEGNTNYGAVVSIWDRLFGSSFLPPGRPFDATIGIAGDADYPQDFVGQLRAPFTT